MTTGKVLLAVFVALTSIYYVTNRALPQNLFQSYWDRFLAVYGDDESTLYIYGTTLLTTSIYWVAGMLYVLMDIFNWPRWTRQYKVQPGTNEPVDMKRLISAAGQVLFNQTFVGIPFMMVTYYGLLKPKNVDFVHELPYLSKVVIDLIVFVLMEEIGFYYSHRLLHHPRIYKYIHKKHHQWTAPIAITAAYCHPVEHVFANTFPLFLGPYFMSSHMAVIWLWLTISVLGTLSDHSGYHFPGFRSPEFHDFHHLKFTDCFGLLGILDYLHGTDKQFRSSVSFKRHFTFWSLKSIRTQIPDAAPKNAGQKYVWNSPYYTKESNSKTH